MKNAEKESNLLVRFLENDEISRQEVLEEALESCVYPYSASNEDSLLFKGSKQNLQRFRERLLAYDSNDFEIIH